MTATAILGAYYVNRWISDVIRLCQSTLSILSWFSRFGHRNVKLKEA